MKQVIDYPGIGPIVFSIRRGLRTISYKVSAKEIVISAPYEMQGSVFPLSANRIEWILNAKQEMQKKTPAFIISPSHQLLTRTFEVAFEPMQQQRPLFKSHFQSGVLTIYYYYGLNLELDEYQTVIQRIVLFYLKKEAARVLPERLTILATQLGYHFNEVKINSAKGRWGSCSACGAINLSCYLMLLPQELIDYVLVHELCHTKEMNHGEKFKQLMRGHFPRFGEMDRALKAHGRRISGFKI